MATMVKEKRREKKKTKDKHSCRSSNVSELSEQPPIVEEVPFTEEKTAHCEANKMGPESHEIDVPKSITAPELLDSFCNVKNASNMSNSLVDNSYAVKNSPEIVTKDVNKDLSDKNKLEGYKELSKTLDRMAIPCESSSLTIEQDIALEHPSVGEVELISNVETQDILESALPSAPLFEEEIPQHIPQREAVVREIRPKTQCMPLEEAINWFGGMEMAEVRAMSEREEALVEAGPMCGPEHPLVDLLSTFRYSIIAIERERSKLAHGYSEEEKSRSTLWKIEKRNVNVVEPCACGANVSFKGTYEHATLMKEKLPVARLRLESLLRDVQESYCHYQHAALLAHCQIEELVSEIIQSSKPAIREALSLILQALRVSDNAPSALASALQRWAEVLASALIDMRDLRNLLFLIHHLFRQTRSVQWAARTIRLQVVDRVSAAQAIAVLDLLLARPKPRLDSALECTEETDEAWEEVDRRGEGSAVSEGALRERDLLAILAAMPLRSLVATLVLFTNSNVRQARECSWGESSGGGDVVRACCGVRALVATCSRASRVHAQYDRLRATLRTLAARAMHALAALHMHSRDKGSYTKKLEPKISAELQACFTAGFTLFGTEDLHKLPATLLSDEMAKEYCTAFILALHDSSERKAKALSIVLPVPLLCGQRVRIVTNAAVDRLTDHELAGVVLHFLLQTGIKRKVVQCKGSCDETARQEQCLARLINAHPYLHTIALHALPDLNIVEPLDPSAVKVINVKEWRPMSGELIAVLDDWAQRCPQLLQHLLLELDYTPFVGVSLDSQLALGRWLCHHVRCCPPAEWAWSVLRRVRVHLTCWHHHAHAHAHHHAHAHAHADVPPDEDPPDVFSMAYALLSTAWGHSIPLICSSGVSALCTLAATRPRDAVHCLAPIMLVMAHSPESVSLTPKFSELFTILLSSGPTLVQRALGRGGACGADLLLRLLLYQLRDTQCGNVLRSTLLSCWLHALWRGSLPAACTLLEVAAIATREWPLLDSHAMLVLASENSSEYINGAVRNASQAPLLCECMLRASHAHEVRTQLFARLTNTLRAQRLSGHRIHVDNALHQMGVSTRSEELVIYRVCTGALSAPMTHPSHLSLWRLLLHLYLQRAPDDTHESAPPIGPLFFSGLIKTRTLNQIKKRLQETIAYHKSEAETFKKELNSLNKTVRRSTTLSTSNSNVTDDNLLPALSIIDLTGESSDSSDSDDGLSEEEERGGEVVDDTTEETQNLFNLLLYHNGAEKLICEYSRWLEEGDKTRAAPHHADIARFIPEHALEAAWRQTLSRLRPPPSHSLDDFPLPAPRPPAVEVPHHTPFNTAVNTILKIRDRSAVRSRRTMIQSPVDDVDFKDSRTLVALVDKHLKDIERLAQEWNAEVYRVSTLDNSLWEMVCALRVRRPLPDVKRNCANKCKPITLKIPAEEWCISTGAERGIKENRCSARAGIRRLARPRPHVARTATALSTIARRVTNAEGARRVVERAWRSAGASGRCAHAHATVTALVTNLAERWFCEDGRLCAELLSRWCGRGGSEVGEVEAALCGALVEPRRLPPAHGPLLYCSLLTAPLPDHSLFSYLSRFEMSRYSQSASGPDRRDMLEALIAAAQRWGPSPEPQHHAVLELVGVHSHALLDAPELCAHVVRGAHATRAVKLPPPYWDHVVRAVVDSGGQVPFDQLGNVLREVGAMWWEVRTSIKSGSVSYVRYGGAMARLLHALLRAFVSAALALSYAPERVAWYAHHALQESWSPWISPHHSPPLLPSTADDEVYTTMLRSFVDTVQQVICDCPGTEVHLLQQIFEWTVQTHANALTAGAQETHVQMSALLAGIAKLPWTLYQWFYGKTLNVALQVCASTDKELTSWCCGVIGGTNAHTLVRDESDNLEQVAPRLAALLYLFTAPTMDHTAHIIEEATRLPWWRLPELALDEAMERFFVQHHNPALPYHDLPQFRVILHAAELIVESSAPAPRTPQSRVKRARGVSQCVRALGAPALTAHVPQATLYLLNTITSLQTYLDSSGDELEELLSRAVVIMCMEPAAAAALPVWIKWVQGTSPRMILACISAAGVVTAFDYFATLADAVAKAHLTAKESLGWREVVCRWCSCGWRECHALCGRARLHAAYALALTHTHNHQHKPQASRAALNALLTCHIDFVENETIIALWICYACRIALECGNSSEDMECKDTASNLLARWADQPRRSLLRVVTLHADTDRPTAKHRLLCRFAQCILSPSENTSKAYEVSCSTLLGSSAGDVITWARSPHHKRLSRLAIRLFPSYEVYFKDELDLAPDES